MNCDQAFDCLTDPVQRSGDDLRRHLRSCPRCRDLADALEPALELFGASDPARTSGESGLKEIDWFELAQRHDDATRDRPSNQSKSAPLERSLAQARVDERRAQREGVRIALALIFIGVITAAVAHWGRDSSSPLGRVAAFDTDSCLRLRIDEGHEPAPTLAACLACHLDEAEAQKLGHESCEKIQRVLQSCVVCHLENTARQELAVHQETGISQESCLRHLSGG